MTKRQRVSAPWNDPFGDETGTALPLVQLMRMVSTIPADDIKGAEMVRNALRPLVDKILQDKVDRDAPPLVFSRVDRNYPWPRY